MAKITGYSFNSFLLSNYIFFKNISICPANMGIIQFKLYVSLVRMKEAAEVGFLRMKIAAFTQLYLAHRNQPKGKNRIIVLL
jgi:hypothetical protein